MVVRIEKEAYLNAGEVAERLGVKRQTLYAYVSRGLLRSFQQGMRRQRLYLKREVEGLLRVRPAARRVRGPRAQSRRPD